jgi:RNA polymerase sigma-70 factor, ECF subfamily
MAATDEEIVGVLSGGAVDESMRALVGAYGPALYGFVLKRTGDPGLAEEIVQDTMVRVWQNAARFDERKGSFRNWVYEIANNLAIDAQRRQAVRPTLGSQQQQHDELSAQEEPLEREILRWQLRSVLAELRPEHREVIALIHFEGLKAREAAERLRIPVGTVKSRCYYALESLRIAFEEQGLGE